MLRRSAWLLLPLTIMLSGCWWTSSDKKTGAPDTPPAVTEVAPAPDPGPAVKDGDLLVVGLPQNDCVNLRAKESKQAAVLACLSGGTAVTAVMPLGGTGVLAEGEGETWVYVRTASGTTGWAAMGAGQLTVQKK